MPDELGRIVVTGTCTNDLLYNADPLKDKYVYQRFSLTMSGDNISPIGIILENPRYLSINYYDGRKFGKTDYNLDIDFDIDFDSEDTGDAPIGTKLPLPIIPPVLPEPEPSEPIEYDPAKKGLLTATRVYNTSGLNNYIETNMQYDNRGRLIKSVSYNKAGTDSITSHFTWSFNNLPVTAKHTYYRQGKTGVTEQYRYAYDHALRLTTTYYQLEVNNQLYPEITLSENRYNELEQLAATILHGSEQLVNTYSYHVRSYLTGISNNLFKQELYYEVPIGNSQAIATGNISAMRWKTAPDSDWRNYCFDYDRLGRIRTADYSEGESMNRNVGSHSIATTYDVNGNIQTMRQGSSTATYSYNGNQLTGDGTQNLLNMHTYNANGNLEKDYLKNIAKIEYNILNLPRRVQLTNGSTIEYMYYADGSKKQVTYNTAKVGISVPYGTTRELQPADIASTRTVEYLGSLVYENGNLLRIHNEQGYVTFTNGQAQYHYYLRDHQGNIRVVADHEGNAKEVNHYYPFGGTFASSASIQPHKYSGKELETTFNLNQYDFSARWMNPTTGRFTTPDPMSEKYYSISPYAYCANNPVNLVDPTGMDVVIVGPYSKLVADELNKVTKVNLSYDSNNEHLSYTKEEGIEYSEFDQLLMTIIDDSDITVKLSSVPVENTYTHRTADGENFGTIIFGSFEGNKIREQGSNKHIWATQSIDINTSINAEKAGFDRAGHVVAHELMEGYFVGKDFPGAKSNDNKAYMSGHLKALDILPLKITQPELYSNGMLRVSFNGFAPVIVRPPKK